MSNDTYCDDCGVDVGAILEYAYVVHKKLWPKRTKFLCIGCFETRLGRELCWDDFDWDIALNRWKAASPRLWNRRGRVPIIGDSVVLLPSHSDPELGVEARHYHVDPRYGVGYNDLIRDEGQKLEWGYRERCIDWENREGINGVSIYLQLLKYYEGAKLIETKTYEGKCGVCPHKKLPLNAAGRCLGHGLCFDSNGKVIGTFAGCHLQIPGTRNVSERGRYDSIRIVESCRLMTVDLMFGTEKLTWVRMQHMEVGVGDLVKMTFSINDKPVQV